MLKNLFCLCSPNLPSSLISIRTNNRHRQCTYVCVCVCECVVVCWKWWMWFFSKFITSILPNNQELSETIKCVPNISLLLACPFIAYFTNVCRLHSQKFQQSHTDTILMLQLLPLLLLLLLWILTRWFFYLIKCLKEIVYKY